MDRLSSITKWLSGENHYGRAQIMGHEGNPYVRYDLSHHLHRAIDRAKMGKLLGLLLLASWMIFIGISLMTDVVYRVLSAVFAVLAIATGTLILLCRNAAKPREICS